MVAAMRLTFSYGRTLIWLLVSNRLFSIASDHQVSVADPVLDLTKNSSVSIHESPTDPLPAKMDRNNVNQLLKEAEDLQKSGNPNVKNKIVSLYKEVLRLDPRHMLANLKLGLVWITEQDVDLQRKGFTLLEKTLDEKSVDNPFLHDTPQAFTLSQTIGRYRFVSDTCIALKAVFMSA